MTTPRIQPIDIVIIEDDPEDANMLIEGFNESGIRGAIRHFENGATFLKSLETGEPIPHLITLDMLTPGATGLEVLDTLVHNDTWKNIKVVVLTDFIDRATRMVCETRGTIGFFAKPHNFDELVEMWKKIKSLYDAADSASESSVADH